MALKTTESERESEKSCQPIKERHLKTQAKIKSKSRRTFVLSAIEVTGFPRLSTRSVPYAIAFASVLSVFLIDFAFCNISTIHFFLIELETQILINELIRETKTFTPFHKRGGKRLSISLSFSACPLSSSFSLILEKTFMNNRRLFYAESFSFTDLRSILSRVCVCSFSVEWRRRQVI